MATQAQIDIFLRAFYNSWNDSFKDRRAYNFAITQAQAASGLLIGRALDANGQITNQDGLIDPSLVPTFQSLTDGIPVVSTGAVVGNANLARDEGANATRPPAGQEIITTTGRITPAGGAAPTNADVTPTNENNPTTGTDAPVRPITQTQAINNQNNQLVPGPPNTQASVRAIDNAIAATGGPGAGSRGDDNTPPTPSVLVNRLDSLYAGNKNFIPSQANILDNFFSYTYSLSWYLVDPTLYNSASFPTLSKDITGYYLLAQSGGAGTGAGTETSGPNVGVSVPQYGYTSPDTSRNRVLGAERSPYFNLDYYIDNLEIATVYSCGVDSGGPMTNSSISFTVSEPNGLTLPTNLFQAVQAVYGPLSATQPKNNNAPKNEINYASALYCMVIRFSGYNEQGQLITPITNNVSSTNPNAAVEKFIFYQQNSLTYSLGSKLVEYKITGSVPSTQTGFSSNRGSIPFNMQFTGATVKDVLVGQIKQQTASQAAGDNTRNGVPIAPAPNNTGNDPNTFNPQGVAFGAGGL
jgi:hypothetical protein